MTISTSIKSAQTWRLFARNADELTSFEVVKWWEVRRIPFNLIVGLTGIFTIFIGTLLCYIASRMRPPPFAFPDPPLFVLFAIAGYGVLANVCFTCGWFAELVARRVWRERANHFGPISFGLGLLFSIFLTLCPVILLTVLLAYRLVSPPHP